MFLHVTHFEAAAAAATPGDSIIRMSVQHSDAFVGGAHADRYL